MADDFPRDRPHPLLRYNGVTEPYRRPNQIITPPRLPQRERAAHAEALAQAVGQALNAARRQMSTGMRASPLARPGSIWKSSLLDRSGRGSTSWATADSTWKS